MNPVLMLALAHRLYAEAFARLWLASMLTYAGFATAPACLIAD